MIKFEFNSDDVDDDYLQHIIMKWNGEEDDIVDLLDKFKLFLLSKTYPESLIDKIVYLSDNQMAKLKLLGEDNEDIGN